MQEIAGARYLRQETLAEVYDTDERGPHVTPVQVIRSTHWIDLETGAPVTDAALLARLTRENPGTIADDTCGLSR